MKTIFLLPLIALSSCQLGAEQKNLDALLLNPSANVQTELTQVVSSMLGNDKILLKAEDFTKSSTVIIERIILKDANGLRLQGMETEMPSMFKLVKRAEDCFLVQLKTKKEKIIKSAKCKAV